MNIGSILSNKIDTTDVSGPSKNYQILSAANYSHTRSGIRTIFVYGSEHFIYVALTQKVICVVRLRMSCIMYNIIFVNIHVVTDEYDHLMFVIPLKLIKYRSSAIYKFDSSSFISSRSQLLTFVRQNQITSMLYLLFYWYCKIVFYHWTRK